MGTGEFHWTNGWYFKLNDDDSVRIWKTASGDATSTVVVEATIPALEWESVLSHLQQSRIQREGHYCKNCPFAKHVHFEVDGKLVTPSCTGYEPR